MADFISFNEGLTDLINNGLPSTCTFELSTKKVEEFTAEDTYAGGFAKATGTGYAAKTQSEPTAVKGKIEFAKLIWNTEENTDWPSAVKSCVLRDGEKLVCAWNLQPGGTARNMAAKNTKEEFTPVLEAK